MNKAFRVAPMVVPCFTKLIFPVIEYNAGAWAVSVHWWSDIAYYSNHPVAAMVFVSASDLYTVADFCAHGFVFLVNKEIHTPGPGALSKSLSVCRPMCGFFSIKSSWGWWLCAIFEGLARSNRAYPLSSEAVLAMANAAQTDPLCLSAHQLQILQ